MVIDELKYTKMLQTKNIPVGNFKRLKGEELNLEYVKQTGLRYPVIVEDPDGLGMKMPPSTLTVLSIS